MRTSHIWHSTSGHRGCEAHTHFGDEVGVRPFLVEELEIAPVLVGEGPAGVEAASRWSAPPKHEGRRGPSTMVSAARLLAVVMQIVNGFPFFECPFFP